MPITMHTQDTIMYLLDNERAHSVVVVHLELLHDAAHVARLRLLRVRDDAMEELLDCDVALDAAR